MATMEVTTEGAATMPVVVLRYTVCAICRKLLWPTWALNDDWRDPDKWCVCTDER